MDPPVIDVSVPARSGKKRDGIRVHRPRHLDAADVTSHRGLPVTTVDRTLIDLAEMVSIRSLERAWAGRPTRPAAAASPCLRPEAWRRSGSWG